MARNPNQKDVWIDDELWKATQAFVDKNPKEKSVSGLIGRLLSQHLRPRVGRYKIKLPQSSLLK
jgi:hypothetical protein